MSRIVCASDYGGPSDPTSGTHGYKGDNLNGKMAFAELNMGTALGNLPYKSKVTINYKGKSVIAEKLDIGAGGGPCHGHARRIDLWYQTAQALGFSGLDTVTIETEAEHSVGKDKHGEPIEGLLEPFGGPHSPGALEGAAGALSSWTGDLAKVLKFLLSASGWQRILKILAGGILLIIAIDELSKIGPGPNTNLRNMYLSQFRKGQYGPI